MKKFVSGLILGVGLMIGMNASAEVVNYVGKVIEGQFAVTLNGKKIDQPGIVVDGVSYLPTRTIAEMFGADVKFDENKGIVLTRKETIQTTKVPTIHPISVELQKISQEISEVGTAKLRLESEIYSIRNWSPEAQQGIFTSEQLQKLEQLEKQLAEYENQLKALEAEKAALEAQLNAQLNAK